MDESVLQYIFYQIANAPIRTYPYTHIYVENIFPQDFYEQLCAQFPDTNQFSSISKTGSVQDGTYQNRFVLPLKTENLSHLPFSQLMFWGQISQALADKNWMKILLDKFHTDIRSRFADHYHLTALYPKSELICDQSDYSIGPHTDHSRRILTLLFYLPDNPKQSHLGTSLYRPKDPHFTCPGTTHHPFERFTKVYTAPFLPNSLFGFIRSDRSFHGVEPIGKNESARRLLNYTLYWAPPESIL